ncbi:MAG: nickel pincer cofactor biosynthesis protein LarC [Thermoguttaceae bacterium]|nr:nickel pincer cofactor biosynthesis protein LarC [Thermoguttaceae bacterium]
MKILRFDSVGGGSGDMILNALIEFCEMNGIPQTAIEEPLHQLVPDHFHLRRSEKGSHGMSGKTLVVDLHEHHHEEEHHHHHHEEEHHHHDHEEHHHHHDHAHRSWADIRAMIEGSALPAAAKNLSLEVFRTLAEAEGKVHGKPADEVHFHEVGAVDSIIDICGCCLAFTLLGVDGISLSPLPVGIGTVRCAHGVYPLPAPATQELLSRFSLAVSADNEPCEMLTPTAAALFAVWKKAEIRGNAVIRASFNSFGHREMESRPNVLRVTLYESENGSEPAAEAVKPYQTEQLIQFEANLDDVTGEQLGAAMASFFECGALDVWFTPMTMKKQRPAVQLGVLARPEAREALLKSIFTETGTFGVREFAVTRYSLERRWETVETKFGPIRVKIGTFGGSDVQFAPEFEDCQAAAQKGSVPVSEVFREALACWSCRGDSI